MSLRIPEWNPRRPQVPVDEHGNWLAYPDWRHKGWEPVRPFHAIMEIDGMETGRSAKRVILKDENGKKYPMFVSDLIKGIQMGTFQVSSNTDSPGRIEAWWTASKRGSNYGIQATNDTTDDWDK
jgi:hypothetical protein